MRPSFHRALWLSAFILLVMGLGLSSPAAAAKHRLGLGIQFWRALEDFDDKGFSGIERDGIAWVGTYQYDPAGLFKLQLDLEYSPDGFAASTKPSLSPVAFVLLGKGLYGGVGAGISFSDGLVDNRSDPFWVARLGLDLLILPKTRLDLRADYRARAFDELDNVKTDGVTLGAAIRFRL
jgi:hypothetical protein